MRSYGRRYQAAESPEELLILLSEALVVSASGIPLALRMPRRGAWILAIQKIITPAWYDRFVERDNEVWTLAILCVAGRLREFLANVVRTPFAQEIYEQSALYASSVYACKTPLADDQAQRFKAKFLTTFAKRKAAHQPKMGDELSELVRARGGLPKSKKSQAELIHVAFVEDLLAIVEPTPFYRRWSELGGDGWLRSAKSHAT